MRLGEGDDFGHVLVELRSAGKPPPPSLGDHGGHATKQLAMSSGLDVPDDDVSQPVKTKCIDCVRTYVTFGSVVIAVTFTIRQNTMSCAPHLSCRGRVFDVQVGRVETAVAFLRHIERLATRHIPRDTTRDIDCNVRQALRVGKRIQKRVLQEETATLVNQNRETSMPTMSSADLQQQFEAGGPDDAPTGSAQRAPIWSAGKRPKGPDALSAVSKTPSPVAPFCVDTSLQTFQLFLDLIKGIREGTSPRATTSARNPAGVDQAEPSTAPGQHIKGKTQFAAEGIGPECCGEPATSSLAKPESFDNQASKQRRATPVTRANGFAVGSRSIRLEVLRRTLKILRVNLFHLVRVAATRRASRGNDLIDPSSAQLESTCVSNEVRAMGGGRQDSGTKCRRAAGEEESTERASTDSRKGSRPRIGVENVGIDNKHTSLGLQGITFQTLDQNSCPRGRESTGDKHGAIEDLHDELQAILEEEIADEDAETTAAALAVQVSTVLTSFLVNVS